MQKSFHGPRAQAVEPILSRDTSADAYSRRVVPLGGQKDNIFTSSPSNPPKPHFLVHNGKPIGNVYSHNCMMHRDTMLKFGAPFDLVKCFEHTKVSAYEVQQGASSPTLNFGTLYLRN